MRFRKWALPLICLCALSALSGCGKDFGNGFGNLDGWGGYTRPYGNVDESYKPVGLCSYTGGCTPPGTIEPAKGWGTMGGSDDKDE
jgi:hypothetical protein